MIRFYETWNLEEEEEEKKSERDDEKNQLWWWGWCSWSERLSSSSLKDEGKGW